MDQQQQQIQILKQIYSAANIANWYQSCTQINNRSTDENNNGVSTAASTLTARTLQWTGMATIPLKYLHDFF